MITEANVIKAGRENSPVVSEYSKHNTHPERNDMMRVEKFFIAKCDHCKNRENCKL